MADSESRMRTVDVVAAVIRDARGRVLLTRRTEGKDFAGRWEFPGGKRKRGESPEDALVRELREELGIEAEPGPHLITVPQLYPDKHLYLDVRAVVDWHGSPRGREQQAMAWVTMEKLARYTMPPADLPVVAALQQPAHYLVTPTPGEDDASWLEALDAALAGGVQRVQLRAPGLDPARWQRLATAAAKRCRKAGAEVLVNGGVELARTLASGIHLTAAQLLANKRRPLPAGQRVGASCHTLEELRHAQAIGCDFAVLGPVKPTASHPGVDGIGWDRFASLRKHVSLPLYAIGGLGPDDLAEARRHGAQGIAAITALWPALTPTPLP
ncbi:Nudix family hydrolase [Marilutibacter alkalisoli]|uniref:8-oxo-dGTP diphosphatase n=1 Tax=Marilutibacter alkalisoli TaxID=2591633 RepID=A0A514BU58_9GAMM|nr:Nudix family hydrolase [Lysobacter alkalisoli]QDH70944.1 Nudix family hydrolase [Lysobacter alkalisoli]